MQKRGRRNKTTDPCVHVSLTAFLLLSEVMYFSIFTFKFLSNQSYRCTRACTPHLKAPLHYIVQSPVNAADPLQTGGEAFAE